MRKPPVLTADRAAALIPDGATVAVSSSSAIGLPEHLLAAIGAHFETTGHCYGRRITVCGICFGRCC